MTRRDIFIYIVVMYLHYVCMVRSLFFLDRTEIFLILTNPNRTKLKEILR